MISIVRTFYGDKVKGERNETIVSDSDEERSRAEPGLKWQSDERHLTIVG